MGILKNRKAGFIKDFFRFSFRERESQQATFCHRKTMGKFIDGLMD